MDKKKKILKERYGALVIFAFNNAFAPILNTANPYCHELVVWYYAGHGLGEQNIKEIWRNTKKPSAIPELHKIDYKMDRNLAEPFIPDVSLRTVKGGELCLHEIGFCDLNGLLEAWIVALKSKSQNIEEDNVNKKNKHLVLILDSCYSGTFAKDLKKLAAHPGPWNENECTVTVQASCSASEQTFGGYFTPLFLYLNENPSYLKKRKDEWQEMTQETKDSYSSLPFPSPVVETTGNWQSSNDSVTMEIECQGFSMQLFRDPGFFKYCFVTWGQEQIDQSSRALTHQAANCFLSQASFQVIDFKLKKVSSGEFADTPLGLFLVKDMTTGHAVCVHIHFPLNDTTQVNRINLVHHFSPSPPLSVLYTESGPKLQVVQTRHPWLWDSNVTVAGLTDTQSQEARRLVRACYDKVEAYECGLWSDVQQWNMRGHQLGVFAHFRLNEHLVKRSQGLNTYLTSLTHQETELPP